MTLFYILLLIVVTLGIVTAESGQNIYLRYAPLQCVNSYKLSLASNIIALSTSRSSQYILQAWIIERDTERLQPGCEGE